MPGFLLGFVSGNPNSGQGGNNLLSGNFFSGLGSNKPVGGIQLIAYPQNSGFIYVTLSGGVTITSGGMNSSGLPNSSGLMDGLPLGPGVSYFVSKIGIGPSGNPTLYIQPDANCSGQARVHVEAF